ncbi:MAG: DJ-1/PfpI family protein [Planctomycetales bacterium]|nr:DJ-1/PfpI family protein [Planctomycetales bacterium]
MHRFRIRFVMPPAVVAALFATNPSPAAAAEAPQPASVQTLGLVLFDGFEILDACGPLEVWGNLKTRVKVVTVAATAGPIKSSQGAAMIADHSFADCPPLDMLLIPGGLGAFTALKDEATLEFLRKRSAEAKLTMSVCNGASLLAAAGLLDGRKATTNKAYWKQSTAPGPKVDWIRKARWVDDGNVVTSSGVSAGIDMTFHVVERWYGAATADRLADEIEYERHRDAAWDPFAEKNARPAKKKKNERSS